MRKKTIYLALLVMMFSMTTVHGDEVGFYVEKETEKVADGIQDLTIEDAIIKAQKTDKKLKTQKTNIELAEYSVDAAKQQYYSIAGAGFQKASADYTQAKLNKEYEEKNKGVMEEEVAFDIENMFDDILELEGKLELLTKNLSVQKQKIAHAIRRESLGLGSKVQVQAEEAKMASQNKEQVSLVQAIDTQYRKLNDAIGGEEERYNLVKENIYEPLEMERSLQGQISHAINSDLGLWFQEEVAKSNEITLGGPGPDGYAPTYTFYQQRKLSYEQGLNKVALSKEGKKEQIKQIYENIQALEIQYDKTLIDIAENQRQYRIMQQRYELGMITAIVLDELQLATLQNEMKLSSTIRQHNQLKVIFEKSYLGVPKI